ncbi:FecCD family ABC transporter permease [Caproiciproducens faecalis]|uniref:Iron ABC transporter permease n=1 Tax=Caproiciproducens faecalis TaxID=2820301 RepID=A0ABS7DKD4_9FIRM|nr:iron ABC transporter permease [Caproiciproducens faecalis]MBW7571295.1 iron ABC transporter permease [Caproiciproducens faecalis]
MEKSRQSIRAKKRIGLMLLLLLLMIVVGILGGSSRITLTDFRELFSGQELTAAGRIILYVRLPRVAGAVIAGMALAVAGAVIQTVLNNPLAGPNIIGVNSGAGFAAVLCGVLLPKSYLALPAAAFAGAFLTVLFVFYLGKKTGSSKITLILAGVAINSFLGGATDAVNTFSQESLIAANAFKIGGLNGVNANILKFASILVIVAVVAVLLFHNELEILSLGEETAKTLGLPVSFYRFLFLMLAAVLSGAAVSFAGLLGFVGLIVPHIARFLVGEESKDFILSSAVLGALFLLICDTIARTCFAPFELPVGIILSFVGAPFFIWLLFHRKRRNRNA